MNMVADGLIGDCPKVSPVCEIFLTIVDNPDPALDKGGPGKCEVAVPVHLIQLHSTPPKRQVLRWKILNSKDFGFAPDAITIRPNLAAGDAAAFEDNKFTTPGMNDQYQWQSTGRQTIPKYSNGYIAYVVRKLGNLACGTKDPLIVNLP